MPRYASNLSFNPLEPLKPSTTSSINTTTSSSISKSDDAKISVLPSKLQQQPDVIPEVEFDWNSSGLVNPLDGEFYLYFKLNQTN